MTDNQKSWEICYRRQLRQNELMICVEEDREERYETRMLSHNTIPGLLKFTVRRMDDKCWFCYQITSRQPLARLLETQQLGAEQIRRILMEITGILKGIGDYLLPEEQILLEPEFIYMDPESWAPQLCLMPGKRGDFPREFSGFLQYLLEKTDHQDKDGVVLIYGLYRESLKENYGFDHLLGMLAEQGEENKGEEKYYEEEKRYEVHRERGGEKTADDGETEKRGRTEDRRGTASVENSPAGMFVTSLLVPVLALAILWIWGGRPGLSRYGSSVAMWSGAAALLLLIVRLWNRDGRRGKEEKAESSAASPKPQKSWEVIFEEETEEEPQQMQKIQQIQQMPQIQQLPQIQKAGKESPGTEQEADSHTVLLWSQEPGDSQRRLVSTDRQNADIDIPYYPFLIGKQETLNDYVLRRETVSRLHIRLDREGEEYRLTDLNSTNGTAVNQRKLEANETVELSSGDEVMIADQAFRFQ